MRRIVAKILYPPLLAKRWPDPLDFLSAAAHDINHPMWGPGGAGREFVREILSRDNSWSWLADRIDDFAGLIEETIRKKLNRWIWRSHFEVGGLWERLCDTETTAKWLMDRYVAELKNLFDAKYKNYIDINAVSLIQLHEDYASAATETWQNYDPSEESTLKAYHMAESLKYE